MFNRISFIVLAVLFAVMLYPRQAQAAQAVDGPGFLVTPVKGANPATTEKGYFLYDAQPGNQVKGALFLRNQSRQPLSIVLEAVDALTAATGGSAFTMSGEPLTASGVWIKLDTSPVTLGVGEEREVGFTVQVPQGAAPKQYLAGIAAYVPNAPAKAEATSAANQAQMGINLQIRRVIAVQVNVPGAWKTSLSISDVMLIDQPSGYSLGVKMSNDGDVFVKTNGTLLIADASGKKLVEQQLAMGSFVPGTEVVYPLRLAGKPPVGDYQVSVEMNYANAAGDTGVARYSNKLAVRDAVTNPAEQPAPNVIEFPAVGQPAAAPSQDLMVAAPASDGPGLMPWTFIGSGVLVMLMGLAIILLPLRRRNKQAAAA